MPKNQIFSILGCRNNEVFLLSHCFASGTAYIISNALKPLYDDIKTVHGKKNASDYIVIDNCIIKKYNDKNIHEILTD
jgi:hypothetical protein